MPTQVAFLGDGREEWVIADPRFREKRDPGRPLPSSCPLRDCLLCNQVRKLSIYTQVRPYTNG